MTDRTVSLEEHSKVVALALDHGFDEGQRAAYSRARGEIIAALTHGDEFERLVKHVASAWGGTSATHLAQVKRILRHAADHFAEQSRLSAPVVALQAEGKSA